MDTSSGRSFAMAAAAVACLLAVEPASAFVVPAVTHTAGTFNGASSRASPTMVAASQKTLDTTKSEAAFTAAKVCVQPWLCACSGRCYAVFEGLKSVGMCLPPTTLLLLLLLFVVLKHQDTCSRLPVRLARSCVQPLRSKEYLRVSLDQVCYRPTSNASCVASGSFSPRC